MVNLAVQASSPVTLYQFALCPFCHKVKATLDVKGIDYRKVEVNPMTKAELPALPDDAPKKVPRSMWRPALATWFEQVQRLRDRTAS